MKGKKEKLLGNFVNAGEVEIPKLSPLKRNVELKVTHLCIVDPVKSGNCSLINQVQL